MDGERFVQVFFHVPASLRQHPGHVPIRHRAGEPPSPVPLGWRADRASPPTSTHHRALSVWVRRTGSAKVAGLQGVGPSTAKPPRLDIHRRTRPVSRARPPSRWQMLSRPSRAPRASTATKGPSKGVPSLVPAKSARSVRISTCWAPAVSKDPS